MKTVAGFATAFAAAFAAGAALMYYLDPVAGRRRRALARDRGVSASHDAEHFARAKSKRAIDRAHRVVARARAGSSHAPVDDGQLHGRIRTRLGRMVAHPGEVNIEVNGGRVVLRGHATDAEIEDLTSALVAMPGVADVDNRLSADAPESRH
ncbi:MAG: BON domain-containing protein [Lysobacter sp.]